MGVGWFLEGFEVNVCFCGFGGMVDSMSSEVPKIIHYVWVGGKPLPELAERCVSSWGGCLFI